MSNLFARLDDDVVVEVIEIGDGLTIDDMFHPQIASLFVPVPEGTTVGWVRNGEEFEPNE